MRRTLTGGLINLYGSTKKYRKIRAGTDPDPTRSILIKNCQTDDYGPLRPGAPGHARYGRPGSSGRFRSPLSMSSGPDIALGPAAPACLGVFASFCRRAAYLEGRSEFVDDPVVPGAHGVIYFVPVKYTA